jgi:hypothetical protein
MTTALTTNLMTQLTALGVNSLDVNSRAVALRTEASSRPGGYWHVVTQDAAPQNAAPQNARDQHIGFSAMATAAKLGPPPRGVPR